MEFIPLKELGILLGPRRKLAKAIAGLHGKPAAPPDDAAPAVSSAPPVDEADRRQLSVIFVDLVGSTALSGRLDPEDMGAVIRAYQDACAGVITRFGGHVE